MEISKLIKSKIKQKRVIIGFNNVLKSIKNSNPNLIVLANNFPEEKKKIIKHNAKISGIEVKEHTQDNVNLGLICGKPFPVGVLAIKR